MRKPFHHPRLVALAVALILSACHDINDAPVEIRPELERIDAREAAMSAEGKATYRSLYSDGTKLAAFLSNSTVRHYDALHGAQVEFLGTDGKTALWYPGNSRPVFGFWKIKQTFDGPDMCFLYGSNTYNPVTKQGGGSWECGDASLYLIGMAESVEGDLFRLMTGRVPFALSKEETTLKQLAGRAGTGPLGANKVNW
jgi:hypothetical protein